MTNDNITPHIRVVDSPVGSGKTTWAIQAINKMTPESKVIFITPYLTEVERIIQACPDRGFVQPDVRLGKGSKRNHLLQLLLEGRNIVSTHALFSAIDDELIEAIRANTYVLILDEVMNVVSAYNMYEDYNAPTDIETATLRDIHTLLERGIVTTDENFLVKWNEGSHLIKYRGLKSMAERNLLYFVRNKFLIWTFPIDVFMEGIFESIWILTYMFHAQMQSYYYHSYGLKYETYHVKKEGEEYFLEATTSFQYELDWLQRIASNIFIYEGDLNRIGASFIKPDGKRYNSPLSVGWFKKFPTLLPSLRTSTERFFRHVNARADDVLWTCFKDFEKGVRTKYSSGNQFLHLNARATNDYANRTKLAYLANRYINPFYAAFFKQHMVTVNMEATALSDIVQWIFRSAIRNDKPIDIFIPSERMRWLLQRWLKGESIYEANTYSEPNQDFDDEDFSIE